MFGNAGNPHGNRLLHSLLPVLCLALASLLLAPQRGYAQDTAPAVDPAAAPAAANGTTVDRDITTNTTWTKAGSPYNVADLIDVEAGATLTIEPGVVVQVGKASDPQWSYPFTIKGTLLAQGTAAEPITFTGLTPAVGRWQGLVVGNTEAQPARATLDHVIIEYGGITSFGDTANLELHSAVADVNNSLFRNGSNYGVSVDFNTQLNLRNSSFTGNGVGALIVDTIGPNFALELSNLTASGNGVYNAVVYDGVGLDRAWRFKPTGLPYVLENGFSVDRTDEKLGELTIDPGIQVYVDTGFYVYGNLKALGTAAQPILISGIKQQPAGWWGMRVSGGSVELDHVTVEYGGEDTEDWGGNLSISSAVITVTNSILRNSGSHGIFSDGGSPDELNSVKVSNTTITGSRLAAIVCADESCNYDFNNLTVAGNGTDGIVYRSFAMSSGTWRNLGLPYIIEGQGGVGADAVLTIEPGVEVRMTQDASFAVLGVLSAVGTADQPIRFTGTEQQAGWWQGMTVDNDGVAELRFCDLGYGGNWGQPDNGALLMTQSSSLSLTNCRIHDSSSAGIMVVGGAQPTIRNNRIENNKVGLNAVFPLQQVDARFNWWGDASGPKHPNNPNGQGQQVVGDVAFEPWLTSPDDTGGGITGITVDLNGPGRFAPGQTVLYSVFYYNGTGAPIENAVLRFGMPANAVLLESSPNGVFHAERNHVFWKLGSLPQAGQGLLWVRVRFDWGLADGLKAATAAQLSGSNLPGPLFDVNDYLTYTPRTLTSVTDLGAADVDALRAGNPTLDTLYRQATGDGFKFASVERQLYSTGQEATQIDLLRFQEQYPQFSSFSIYLSNGNVVGILVDGNSYTVVRGGRAVRYDMQSNAWEETTLGMLQTAEAYDGISWGECIQNCIEEKLPGYFIKKKIKSLSDASKAISCLSAAQGDEGSYLGCAKIVGKVAKQLSPVSEGIDLGMCNGECQLCEESGGSCDNPNCHCCTEDRYRCDSSDWVYGTFGIDVVKVKRCNLDEGDERGTYFAEEVIKVCALCEKCMLGGAGAPVCVAKVSNVQVVNTFATLVGLAAIQGAQDRMEIAASSDEECDECRQAKDPNAMYGPAGDLLPGQIVTYEVEYENVGEGVAFGVFIANKLPVDVFDLATLQINDGGSYSAGAGSIFWDVGDLAPKGQDGSQGKVSYSVRLRSDLPSGTVIPNQAIVHFPSVPEETPTNRLLNLIQPLVADAQALETEAGQPIAITLSGKDAVGAPLEFAVVEAPQFGVLSGTAPNLQYTPGASASGIDHLRFTASNGTSTSVPADVSIRIRPSSSDVTGPGVQWTAPAAGASVKLATLVAGTDATGNYYYPAVQVQFTEAVDGATVNGGTVIVTDESGRALAADIRYDGASDQLQLLLREEPELGEAYAVTITGGVKDLRGNPMAANYSWRFTITSVGGQVGGRSLFLPVVAR